MLTRQLFKYLFIIIFFLSFNFISEARTELGKIVQISGDVDLTEINSDIRIVPGIGARILKDYKIRTGAKAYLEILLNDNTKIFMRELSIIQITGLKIKEDDPPTGIILSTGKIRINISKQSTGRNLIIKTITAVIGIKNTATDLAMIATNSETKLVVYEGRAEIASSNRNIVKSYELKKKEEVNIMLNTPPAEPVTLPQEVLDYWLDYYEIIDKNKIVVKGKQDSGFIDYILRKRKF